MAATRIFAFINGRFGGSDLVVVAVAEDGTCLAQHVSSGVSWARHDIGVTSDWKHDIYAERYPDGFAVEWVDDPADHPDLQRAIALNAAVAANEAKPRP